jgi:hypothetical protein
MIHGYAFCDFVPEYGFAYVSVGLAALLGIGVFAGLAVFQMRHGGSNATAFQTVVAWIFGPVFLSFFFWFVVGKSLPGQATALIGAEHVEETRMTKSHPARDRSFRCRYRLRGGVMHGAFPDFVCISPLDYARLSDGPILVRLYGRQSVLGFLVQDHEIVADLGHEPAPAQAVVSADIDRDEIIAVSSISPFLQECRTTVGVSARARYRFSADISASGKVSSIEIKPDNDFAQCIQDKLSEATLSHAGGARTLSFEFEQR